MFTDTHFYRIYNFISSKTFGLMPYSCYHLAFISLASDAMCIRVNGKVDFKVLVLFHPFLWLTCFSIHDAIAVHILINYYQIHDPWWVIKQ